MGAIGDRIVFIGGLHRSGTTPLARWLADHPSVSGLANTGVTEDEGQHLQSVYPPARNHGGPGRFATAPAARLTESSALVTGDAQERLLEAWMPYWDLSKPVLVEKSPPNITQMRFLRAVFPLARFIMVVRHPIAVAMATSKWTGASVTTLMQNWVAGHEHLVADADAVGKVAVVRYEDLVREPAQELDRLFAFLDLPPFDGRWTARGGLNDAYFDQYAPRARPWRSAINRLVAQRFETDVVPYGYSLKNPHLLHTPEAKIARLRATPRDPAPEGIHAAG
jgi:hypothetical protein